MSTVTIFMKSGNQLQLRGIKDWSVRAEGNRIIELRIERTWFAKWWGTPRLVINSIDLSQIEAVVVS